LSRILGRVFFWGGTIQQWNKRLDNYLHFGNKERPNETLGYKIPCEVYRNKQINVP